VNAGGDIAANGGSWPIAVDGAVTVELTAGALATSGRDRRRWRRSGRELHHLIDPSTGAPAETNLVRATAVATDAAEAEVLAKWLFLAGEDEALASGVTCILVSEDGNVRLGGDLA
jgi:thiamine biosynthesis lipoprotein